MKTYIIPTGWDRELVIKTAFKSGADKICLISAKQKKDHYYSKADKITKEINGYLVEELQKFTSVEFLEVNYVDVKDTIMKINNYLNKNKDEEFIINISTGSHLLSAALMFIAFTKNIQLDYSIAEGHDERLIKLINDGGNMHKGFSKIIQIPQLNAKLKFGPKEKKLLRLLKEKNKICVKDFIGDARGNEENRLRSEFHYLCKKLKEKGFIKLKNKGKIVEVQLTDFGEVFIEEF